jgi:hypothetical protein
MLSLSICIGYCSHIAFRPQLRAPRFGFVSGLNTEVLHTIALAELLSLSLYSPGCLMPSHGRSREKFCQVAGLH